MLLLCYAKVLSDLLKNPLIVSVLFGLLYRPTLGPMLPWWLDTPLELLGRTFAPLVYLIGGFAFCGSLEAMTSLSSAGIPLATVALKSLVLPIVAHGTLVIFDARPTKEEGDFVWL